jgi:hypothetical protein
LLEPGHSLIERELLAVEYLTVRFLATALPLIPNSAPVASLELAGSALHSDNE